MVGGMVGNVLHELLHFFVAGLVGNVAGIEWRGSWLTGGPVVDFQAAGGWRTEAVLKAPLIAGVAAAVVVFMMSGLTLERVAVMGVAVGLLRASPEDLSAKQATASGGA